MYHHEHQRYFRGGGGGGWGWGGGILGVLMLWQPFRYPEYKTCFY